MRLCRINRTCNVFTLKPKTKENKELFWNFRSEDMALLFPFYVGIGAILFSVVVLYNYHDFKIMQIVLGVC